MKQKQYTSTILMVEPIAFYYNPETAVNNYFQTETTDSQENIQKEALEEFQGMVSALRSKGVNVITIKDTASLHTPDSIFPNNWISFHDNGNVVLYPMFAKNRREERREEDVLSLLEEKGFHIDDVIDLHKYKVKGSFMNEERLHLRLVDKTPLPINGEDLFAGITIDSSDVGRSILNCTFLIYKQVCTNGMVVSKANGTLFQQKHIGITSEEFHKGLTEGISIIPILTENAVGLINKSKSIKTTISGYSSMSKIPDDELQDFIAEIKLKTKLSEENANKVIQLMYDKYDSSKFGYLNSITDVAKDFTLERRIELEKYAGDVLVA